MKITIRKVRGKNSYVVKNDGRLIKSFETKKEAEEYYNDYFNDSKKLQDKLNEIDSKQINVDTKVELSKGIN